MKINYIETELNYFAAVNGNKTVKHFKKLSEVFEMIKTGGGDHVDRVTAIRNKIKNDPFYQLSDQYQKKDKASLAGVVHHAKFINYLKEDNLISYTGLLLLDFDGLTPDKAGNLIGILQNLSYVIAAYPSLSESGVHAIVAVSNINRKEDYVRCWHQFTMLFRNEYGYSICQGTGKICQMEVIPYYPQLLINNNVIPYIYAFDQITENEYSLMYVAKANNAALPPDAWDFEPGEFDQLRKFYNKEFGKSFYASLVMVDNTNRKPINLGVDYDNTKHSFTRYFTDDIITSFEKCNAACTMAILPEKASGLELNVFEQRRFKFKKRASQILAIMMQYAFISQIFSQSKSLIDFYCIAIVLNKRCITDTAGGVVSCPMSNLELKWIAQLVFNLHISKLVKPKLIERSVIINEDLYKNVKECDKKSKYMKEYSKIFWGNTKSDNEFKIYTLLNEYKIENPDLKKIDYVNYICEKGFKKSLVYAVLKRAGQFSTSFSKESNTLPLWTMSHPLNVPTADRVKEVIFCLLKHNDLITKGVVADNVGCSTKTVSRNWKPFKPEIAKHNNYLNQCCKPSLKKVPQPEILYNQDQNIRKS